MYLGFAGFEYVNHATRKRFYSTGRPVRGDYSGRPPQFFAFRPQPEFNPNDPLGWLIEHVHQFGCTALEGHLRDWKDQAEVDRIGNLLAKHDVKFTTDYGDSFFDPSKYKGPDEFAAFVRVMKPLGTKFIGIGGVPLHINRFVDDPPFEEQMATIRRALKPLVEVAEAEDVYLAMENHADYTAKEIVQHLCEPIGSKHFGLKFDTGNSLLVIEEPWEAAKVVGTRTYATHFKDMHVVPNCIPGGKVMGAPVGLGSARLLEVAKSIYEQTPFRDDLILSIEVGWVPPNEDWFLWFEESLKWCRENLKQYLTL